MSEPQRKVYQTAREVQDKDLAVAAAKMNAAEEEARIAQNETKAAKERAEAEAKKAAATRAKVYTENTSRY